MRAAPGTYERTGRWYTVRRRIADESLVQQVIETYAAKYGLTGPQLDAKQAFDGVAHMVRPQLILAWSLDRFPQSATRWRFDTGHDAA